MALLFSRAIRCPLAEFPPSPCIHQRVHQSRRFPTLSFGCTPLGLAVLRRFLFHGSCWMASNLVGCFLHIGSVFPFLIPLQSECSHSSWFYNWLISIQPWEWVAPPLRGQLSVCARQSVITLSHVHGFFDTLSLG